jgi:peptide deformylase
MGHPVLRKIAVPLSEADISTDSTQRLIGDMLETVMDADGAGLAAPQVHSSLRIVVLKLEELEGFQIWINPVIIPQGDEYMLTFEGCLSAPGLRGAVARPSAVLVNALDREGQRVDLSLEGYSAVVAQHECDHLDGILYLDKVEPRTTAFLEEYRKYEDNIIEDAFGEDE